MEASCSREFNYNKDEKFTGKWKYSNRVVKLIHRKVRKAKDGKYHSWYAVLNYVLKDTSDEENFVEEHIYKDVYDKEKESHNSAIDLVIEPVNIVIKNLKDDKVEDENILLLSNYIDSDNLIEKVESTREVLNNKIESSDTNNVET